MHFFFEDAANLADYVKEFCPAEAAGVIKAADEVVAQTFLFTLRWDMERTNKPVIFTDEIDWLHQPGDDPEWVYAFNRMRFWICLGQAYALTGDEKYATAFASQMLHWVRTVKQNDPAAAKAWRSIEVGLRLEYWLKAMQYFQKSPAMTADVVETFYASVTEQAEFIMGIWNTYNLMSNWGVLANHGLFLAGAMLPQKPRTAEYIAEATRRLTAEINMQVYRDGTHWEQSPMYHNEVLHCFLDVVLLAQRCEIILPEVLLEKTQAMCRYNLASGKPDHTEPLMGDSDEIDQRDQIVKGAIAFCSAALKARGGEHPDFDAIWDIGELGLAQYRALTCTLPIQTDYFLSDSGNAYLRSGWDETDTWVHFQCGPLGAGHGHADKLHVSVASRGEDVLVDAGRYSYVFGSGRVEFKEMRAHNTILVDNHELYLCKDSWECSRLTRAVNQKFYADARYAYAEGGHLGYTNLPNGVVLNRRVIYLKPDILVLADEFYTCGSHQYQQFFHFAETGTLRSLDANVWQYTGKQVQAQVAFLTQGIAVQQEDTKISRHYNEWTQSSGLTTQFQHNGSGCAFTVIALSDKNADTNLRVKKLPVRSNFKDIIFDDSQIEALEIKTETAHFVLAIAHEEYASPTDTFWANGCSGFGSAVVFDKRLGETETGTVLAW